MALLSGLIREAAITGRRDTLNAWWAGRQGGRWAEQTVRAAFPTGASRAQTTTPANARAPVDPAETLRDLTELRKRGVVTDVELERLRARLQV